MLKELAWPCHGSSTPTQIEDLSKGKIQKFFFLNFWQTLKKEILKIAEQTKIVFSQYTKKSCGETTKNWH